MTKISLSDGYLTTQEAVILSRVPNNVTLTPDSRTEAFNGAFLAVVAPQSSSHHVLTLGTLEGLRFMCCFRFKLWWMTQRMGTCGKDVPVETQFLLVESKSADGKIVYTVFLPVLDGGFRSSLQGTDNNELQICLESGDPAITASQWQHALYIYTGSNPFKAISEAMSATKDHLQSFCLRDDKKLPGMLDWFGWCTWDAFYTDVSADGVRAGLQSLSAGGTPPRFLIIDDGWQSVAEDREQSAEQVVTSGTQFARRLTDIKENHKFQKKGEDNVTIGLEHLVEEAKQKYNLKYIYVWHSMVGYWGGLQPGLYGSELAYPVISPGMLNQQPSMAADSLTINGLGIVDPSKAFEFYDELHSYLASVGVDGVKVDVQSILETLGTGLGGRVELTKRYQKALESSIARNFADNGCIACMSHNTDGLYSSKQTAVVRASDDFWPADPASHTIHVASVAYNSLFLGEVMQPDWDMFQSLHPAAEYHGAARAVGGCGVYVSDKPGQHNFDLLKKLVLPDGSVLRAQYPGRPTRDSLFSDPTRDGISLLKIWNMNRHTGVLAAFNCQGAGWCEVEKVNRIHDESPLKVRGSVRANDVEFLCDIADDDWNGDSIIFSHRAGELVLVRKDVALPVALEHLQYEVFTVVPVKVLNAYLSFAPIGLVNMFNSGGAIISLEYAMKSGEYAVKIGVRGCGVFGVFCSQRPKEVRVASTSQEFKYTCENGLLTVQVNSFNEGQLVSLEIDF